MQNKQKKLYYQSQGTTVQIQDQQIFRAAKSKEARRLKAVYKNVRAADMWVWTQTPS